MQTKLAVSLGFLILVNAPGTRGQEANPGTPLSVSLPHKAWALEIDAPGFVVKVNEIKPDGRRYLFAENAETHVALSVFLEQVPQGNKPQDCRASMETRKKSNPSLPKRDIRVRDAGRMVVLEYLVPEVQGFKINQQNLFACALKDDVFVDIHLSKVRFVPADEQLFDAILAAVHFTEKKPDTAMSLAPTSKDHLREGSRFFTQGKYLEAIGPYQKALDLEKKDPQLDKTLWRVLVDNLGMSYGIVGNLKSAKETFEYGISKDPTYPLFHYNMACTYAEMDDLEQTMAYLKKAFDYKENVIPGEKMPDPRTDDSFRRFLKNEAFRGLVNSLAGPPN